MIPDFHTIKLVVFDVDGVFTDGTLTFTEHGEEIKTFHVHDGLGVKLLLKHHFQVAIISGRYSVIVQRRMEELGVQEIHQGHEDKLPVLEQLKKTLGVSAEEIAYVGDDLPDLPLIQHVGLGIAVANALPVVKEHANWITKNTGGHGAVREVCDHILSLKTRAKAYEPSQSA